MKLLNLRALVAFILLLQIAFSGAFNPQRAYAVSSTVKEGAIHEFTQNTWAYSNLVFSPSGNQYLSHVKNSTAIAVKKWANQSWNEITAITTSASGDTGFSGQSDIAVDTNETIHAAFLFYQGSGTTSYRGVKYGVYKNGSWSFQNIEAYSDPYGWKNMYNPSIAVDSQGKAHIAYLFNDANDPRKYEIHYATNQSGSWVVKTIASGTSAIDEVKDPQIEIDKNDTIHITYVKEDNQNTYYGNYYYTHKKTTDSAFPAAEKITDAVADQKNYYYTPFTLDGNGKVYFSYYTGNYYTEFTPFDTYFQTNQSGTWKKEQVYNDQQKISYPVMVSFLNDKPTLLMYSESWDWPPSELGFFAMVKDGSAWTKGTKAVSPTLIDLTPSELTYSVDANGNFMIVMLDNGLRKISYLSATSEDFGLQAKLSTNADLSNLTLSAGALTPGFSSGTYAYDASVGYAVQTVDVTPTVADAKATVKVNGQAGPSGAAVTVPLNVGSNTITVQVTAEDGKSVKTYTVNVSRQLSNNSNLSNLTVSTGELTPSFSAMTKDYQVTVPSTTASIRLTPTVADSFATVTVAGSVITSGQQTGAIALHAGTNSIPVVVTAQNGSTTTYTVNVVRNNPPVTADATFSVNENAAAGTIVGTLQASDGDGQLLSYRILSGNTNGVFSLNAATGEIKVQTGSLLDFETTTSYTLAIEVTDGLETTTAIVKINVADLNDNGPVPQGFSANVDENLANGTVIGTVTTKDADAGSQFEYSITSGNSLGAFAIDPQSGVVTVADATKLDYEIVKEFILSVKVSDGANTADTTVTVHLNNLNDNRPVVNGAVFQVNENAANGVGVGTMVGTDADGDRLTYSIVSGNETGAFAIDSATGAITVADGSQLDYETKSSHVLTVRASDVVAPLVGLTAYQQVKQLFASALAETDVATITINVNDLNDNRPVPQGFTKSIDENSANGTVVGTVSANDADAGSALTYEITSGNEVGAFAIDAQTGEVTVADASQLDYETVKGFILSVKVSDGTHSEVTTVTINLTNLNDNHPVVGDKVFGVDENSGNGTAVGTVTGTDADGDTLSYSLVSGNETGAFAINSATGEIMVADGSLLDYEAKTTYVVTVQASDVAAPVQGLSSYSLVTALDAVQTAGTDTATITIHVNDLNDNRPVPQGFTKSIDENTANGTVLGTVTATDADAGSVLTYEITAGNEAGAFAIDAKTGEVTVADASQLDYETVKGFIFKVKVNDGLNTADTTVTVNLNNVNDNQPVVGDAVFGLDENAANGTVVGTVTGSDADGDTLRYQIVAGNDSGAFALDADTGKLTVADTSKLDYETVKSFILSVKVSDGAETANASVTVDVHNVNDNAPVVEDIVTSIDENTANDTEVGVVTGRDADGDALSYRIVSGNEAEAFAIDAATGKITVANAAKLDYEVVQDFTLKVEVSDGTHTAESKVAIHLKNVNDNAPVVEDAEFTIDEKAANGTVLGTVKASDADQDAVTYTVTAGNDEGIFNVSKTTGEVTVADASLLNAAVKDKHTLTISVSDGKHQTPATALVHVLSVDATLSQLTVSEGKLKPDFKPGLTNYHVIVEDDTDSITLTPTTTNGNAKVTINEKTNTSGQESEAVSLDYGKNTITIEVTAQHGEVTVYTIEVLRLQKLVPTKPMKHGESVSFSDEQVNLIDYQGTLVVNLKKSLDDVKDVQFTAEQLEILVERQAVIKIVKDDVQLVIPAVNFAKGGALTISLKRVAKDPKKLPFSDLARSAVYNFTITLGDQVIHQFDHSIELAFSVEGAHAGDLQVYYWNEGNKKWELVGGTLKDGQVTGKTDHFSTFAVFAPSDLVAKEEPSSNDSELPATATNMYNWLLAGILFIIIGAGAILRQRRRDI
ncbi:LPXTG-motif cell wall-anchored protein [Bacillus sp. SLBN-46]|uniref:cadherin domain-containing protein n=1 Tax=Bacillus sp. SLBN-46 TaxID=3042283 RepID=UPI002864BC54|nr:cadherin domain-containing protein [Bacillus sp. SLBN-46]MDR6121340.1 LPXTG-motif cell wall-anchored protein [Bacillus sp. SLBN-46]